jgi:hypothetical protein
VRRSLAAFGRIRRLLKKPESSNNLTQLDRGFDFLRV